MPTSRAQPARIDCCAALCVLAIALSAGVSAGDIVPEPPSLSLGMEGGSDSAARKPWTLPGPPADPEFRGALTEAEDPSESLRPRTRSTPVFAPGVDVIRLVPPFDPLDQVGVPPSNNREDGPTLAELDALMRGGVPGVVPERDPRAEYAHLMARFASIPSPAGVALTGWCVLFVARRSR